MNRVRSIDELEEVLGQSATEPIVLYKHSATCSLSTRAQGIVERWSEERGTPIHRIVVQEAREVSNAVEARYGVRHESPQVLIIKNDRVVAHTSHQALTAGWLDEVLERS